MAKITTKSIYKESSRLKNKILLAPFMRNEERTEFIKEMQTLIAAAQQAEQITNSQETQSRMQKIVEIWEDILIDTKHIFADNLPVISSGAKTSLVPVEFHLQSSHSFSSHRTRLASQILSPSKVDPHLPVTVPRDPELRALFDELYGIVDAGGKA